MPKGNDKMIKNKPKIIFGADWGPRKPPKNDKIGVLGGFSGPPATPRKYFLDFFCHLIIFFGHSAFQGYFTVRFKMILRDVMIISDLLVNIYPFYSVKCPRKIFLKAFLRTEK